MRKRVRVAMGVNRKKEDNMLEYNELESIAGEIAFLRYEHCRNPDNLNRVYEVIGLECALEICGYDATTTVFDDTLNGVSVVDVHIRDKISFKFIETFTYVFSLEGC